MEFLEENPFAAELSPLCRNGLAGCFGCREVLSHPKVIAEAGKAKLELARNLGNKSLRNIAEALYRFGYFDDIEKWLGS